MNEPGPVTVGLRVDDRGPAHTRLSVFVGRNRGARGRAGELTLRTDEWDELAGRLPPSLEVCPAYEQMFSHELARHDVLDSGETVTADPVVDREAGTVVAEVDYRHEILWPAYTMLQVYRPEGVADASR